MTQKLLREGHLSLLRTDEIEEKWSLGVETLVGQRHTDKVKWPIDFLGFQPLHRQRELRIRMIGDQNLEY